VAWEPGEARRSTPLTRVEEIPDQEPADQTPVGQGFQPDVRLETLTYGSLVRQLKACLSPLSCQIPAMFWPWRTAKIRIMNAPRCSTASYCGTALFPCSHDQSHLTAPRRTHTRSCGC